MAQADPAAALASLRLALDESPEPRFRPMLLAACVEAALPASGDRARWGTNRGGAYAGRIATGVVVGRRLAVR